MTLLPHRRGAQRNRRSSMIAPASLHSAWRRLDYIYTEMRFQPLKEVIP